MTCRGQSNDRILPPRRMQDLLQIDMHATRLRPDQEDREQQICRAAITHEIRIRLLAKGVRNGAQLALNGLIIGLAGTFAAAQFVKNPWVSLLVASLSGAACVLGTKGISAAFQPAVDLTRTRIAQQLKAYRIHHRPEWLDPDALTDQIWRNMLPTPVRQAVRGTGLVLDALQADRGGRKPLPAGPAVR